MALTSWQPTPQYTTRPLKNPPSLERQAHGHMLKLAGERLNLDHAPRTVSIVGMGPSLVDLLNETLTQELTTDWTDEVWAINMAGNVIEHDLLIWCDDLKKQQEFKPGLFDLIRKRGKPVLTSVAYPEICESYDYPIDEVAALAMPWFGVPYLNNGVAMAIGYAIHKGVAKIKLYGCDFTYPQRNFAEAGRACVEAWIAIACAKNIEVSIAPHTSLFDKADDQGVYGYAEQPIIKCPDGRLFQYKKPSKDAQSAVFAGYNPTDSSGVPVHGYRSGIQVDDAAGRGADSASAPGPGPGAMAVGVEAAGAPAPAAP